jgi:hypothetical protein
VTQHEADQRVIGGLQARIRELEAERDRLQTGMADNWRMFSAEIDDLKGKRKLAVGLIEKTERENALLRKALQQIAIMHARPEDIRAAADGALARIPEAAK